MPSRPARETMTPSPALPTLHGHAPRFRLAALAVAVAAAALSGCLDGDEGPDVAILVVGHRVTCAESVATCPEWAGSGPLRIAGLEIAGAGGRVGGIRLEALDAPVEVEDVRVTGVRHGIQMAGPHCDACAITVRRTVIDATVAGILGALPPAGLTLEDTALRTSGGGSVAASSDVVGGNVVLSQVHLDGTYGLWAVGSDAPVRLRNVTAEAAAASAGAGVFLDDAGALLGNVELDRVAVSGYDRGIEVRGRSLTVEQVSVACTGRGVVTTASSLAGRGVTVRGCAGAALEAKFAQRVELADVILAESGIGLHLLSDRDVALAGFAFEGNGYGLFLEGDQADRATGTLTDGSVTNQTYVGVQTKWRTLRVSGVRFEGNGGGWPDPEGPQDPYWYGGLVHRDPAGSGDAQVTASSFVANEPFALSSISGLVLAGDNWWASPAGPTLHPVALVPASVGAGPEDVFGTVAAQPHRTAPLAS
jgi:hypothetical protein